MKLSYRVGSIKIQRYILFIFFWDLLYFCSPNESLHYPDFFSHICCSFSLPLCFLKDFVILTSLLISVSFARMKSFFSPSWRSNAIFTNLARFNHDLWAWSGWSTAAQIVESPDDSNDDDDAEVPLFLTRSFCRNPETGGHLSSKPFCFDRRGVDHRLPLSQNHDLLRVIEEDH